MVIKRDRYLQKLIQSQGNGFVKIVTGIRRCGKTYLLLELFYHYLIQSGVEQDHIIDIVLDDSKNIALLNPIKLDAYVRSKIVDQKPYYVLLDEIQKVSSIENPAFDQVKMMEGGVPTIGFTEILLGLMKIPNIDLYVTGSNSKFLSSDILTEFRDRGEEIHVQPLSFSEFFSVYDGDREGAFNEYMLHGGMPQAVKKATASEKEKYLKDLFSLTYHKDVVERNNIRFPRELETLTKVLASTIGSLTNPNIITDTFITREKSKISAPTIETYLMHLQEAFIIDRVDRFDVKGRRHIGATYKYYFADPGLRNARVDFLHGDEGHMLENIIYNELKNRGFSIQVGFVETFTKNQKGGTERKILETDFVARKGSTVYYLQSTFSLYDEAKIEQEKKSLLAIRDSFKKIILVRQPTPIQKDENGITLMSVIDFLLDENGLDR